MNGARRVACLGECMIELRARPDGLPSRGFGGDALDTAVHLSRPGVAVDFVTALGEDAHSEAMPRAAMPAAIFDTPEPSAA